MSFGNKLRILRISNNLDQDTISKKLHISQPVYSRYENDEKEVNEDNPVVKRVSEEFDVPVKWLLTAQNNSYVPESDPENRPPDPGYYSVPKDFLEALLKQQQMTEQMLKLLTDGKFAKK
ncbi:MAG: helix-turn-helix transcriptional regulator [Ferruginibacter sp.]